jgi:DNA polymerase (family 10)
MTNKQLARLLRQTATLLELDGENPFKTKAYQKAADAIRAQNYNVLEAVGAGLTIDIPGVGASMMAQIQEVAANGTFERLETLRRRIPEGVVELSKISGLGPKKLLQLWKEAGIDNPDALLAAAEANRLAAIKGFGSKSQAALYNAVLFYQTSQGKLRLDGADAAAAELEAMLRPCPAVQAMHITGQLRRDLPVIDSLEWVLVTTAPAEVAAWAAERDFRLVWANDDRALSRQTAEGVPLVFHIAQPDCWVAELARTSTPEAHLASLLPHLDADYPDEQALYHAAGLPWVPPCLRDDSHWLRGSLPELLTLADLRGVIHAHSTWSDGTASVAEMAAAAQARGYQYLVMTDHSRSAFYANGLSIERVRDQQAEIEALNTKNPDFRVYKGIESDILSDGSLDYPDEVLRSFDFVIASVHANLQMTREVATQRLLRAIRNPYTTLLGHPTGRLLLGRSGYDIDHERIIDACAEHQVAIEINASPHRLDLDWQWIRYATERGLWISINPDAHSPEGIDDTQYGVRIARKGGLTSDFTLNTLTVAQLDHWLNNKKQIKA